MNQQDMFVKTNLELLELGLPSRLLHLYGRLRLHAGKDGKCHPTHQTLAEEIGLRSKYADRQVRNLLDRLHYLGLIEWSRGRYFNTYRVLDPDRKFISGQIGKKLPLWSPPDRKKISDRKDVKRIEARKEPPLPPSICASDDARVGESALATIPRTTDGYRPEWFEQWWQIWWRRVSKKRAQKAFQAHVKTPERFAQVMAATRAQMATMLARDAQMRPHGATWINDERWNDEPEAPPRAGPQQARFDYPDLPKIRRS